MATASTTTSPPAAANLYVEPDGLPEIYSMHIDGDCMEPIFSSGMRIVVDSAASYRANDIIVLFQNPRVVKPGRYQVLMKRLVQAPPHGFWNEPRSEKKRPGEGGNLPEPCPIRTPQRIENERHQQYHGGPCRASRAATQPAHSQP